MAVVKIRITGLENIQRQMSNAARRYRTAHAAAIYEIAQQTMKQAVAITPKDTGFLRRSAFVTRPRVSGGGSLHATLGFGAPYASQVHDAVGRSFRVGQAKFLSTALNRTQSTYRSRVAALTKRNFKTGSGIAKVTRAFPTRPRRASKRGRR